MRGAGHGIPEFAARSILGNIDPFNVETWDSAAPMYDVAAFCCAETHEWR